MIRAAALFAAVFAGPAAAQTLSFPSNARMTSQEVSALDSYAMAVGPWTDGYVETHISEGRLTRQAWRIEATGLTSLQLIRPLREQLRNDGYRVVYECADRDCGGFDFRFAQAILPPPDMFVSLGDFRYLAARLGETTVSILASPTPTEGYVQVTRVSQNDETLASTSAPALRSDTDAETNDGIAAGLGRSGRAVLDGLRFETGSARLGEGPFDALGQLTDYLAGVPDLTVALVGHTDNQGSLEGNIALSKRRAASVLERLVTDYGVPRRQLDAQGMGYLSPIAPNLTPQGREANRRVEVIITSSQ